VTDRVFDPSALVKRYVLEVGTTWVRSVTGASATDSVIITEVSLAEVAAALAAKQRAPGGLTIAQRDRALGLFLQDIAQRFLIFPTNRRVIDLAVDLTQQYRLRGYDAVQLAAALVTEQDFLIQGQLPPTFVSADNDLLIAAQAEGLVTDNPLNH
jgi:predicted nucleic acid-binding protein